MSRQRARLGTTLKALGIIDDKQLKQALSFQEENGLKLGECLIELKYATQVQITQALARQFSLPYVDLKKGEIAKEIIDCVPKSVVEEHRIVPVKKTTKSIIVAMTDPLDLMTLENLRFILGTEVECALTTPESMEIAIQRL